jgi:hypothetical protein
MQAHTKPHSPLALRTRSGRVSWRCPGFCFPRADREQRLCGAVSLRTALTPERIRGRPRTCQSPAWTREEGCRLEVAKRSESTARLAGEWPAYVPLRRAWAPLWTLGGPAKGRRPGAAESGTALQLENPPSDDCPTERICCSVPSADGEKPRLQPERHSSVWIRTIDLTIMSRAPRYEGATSRALKVQKPCMRAFRLELGVAGCIRAYACWWSVRRDGREERHWD